MPTIISVAHQPINLFNGTLGKYDLPGRGPVGAETGRYVSLKVEDVIREPEDIGSGRRVIHERKGIDIAKALAAPFESRGIFVAAGDEPTEAELDAAEAKYHEFLRHAIEEGMKAWEKRHLPQDVDEHAKIAAHIFRITVPWGVPARSSVTIECDGCGEQISPKLAWHAACGAVFDEERAIALGYVPAIQAKQARMALLAATQAAGQAVPAGKAR